MSGLGIFTRESRMVTGIIKKHRKQSRIKRDSCAPVNVASDTFIFLSRFPSWLFMKVALIPIETKRRRNRMAAVII